MLKCIAMLKIVLENSGNVVSCCLFSVHVKIKSLSHQS